MSGRRLGISWIAFFALCAAAGAGVPQLTSPVRTANSGELRAKRAQAGEEPLGFDVAALSSLRAAGDAPFLMTDFPIAPGSRAAVLLRRFTIAAPDARLRITGPNGDEIRPLPDVAHFTGTVAGEPDSVVYVGATPTGMTAFVKSSAGDSYVGPNEAKTGFVVRDSASPANDRYRQGAFLCAQDQLADAPQKPRAVAKSGSEAPEVTGFRKGTVIVETDQELLDAMHFNGDVDAMTAYALSLFAQIALIDERDLSFHFTVIEVHAWTMPDPWDGPTTTDQLHQLGTWYHANRPLATFPRSTVHLLSGLTVTGGVAWRPALCIDDFETGPSSGIWGGAYGMTQIFGNYPADKWDLHAAAHELGHNQGSAHTHCYVPEIDQCFNLEGGCYSGPTSLPVGGGTLMSYCNLLPGGEDNINLYFHQRCITEQLLPYIQAADCTSAVPTFPDVPTSNPFFHYVETIFQLGITGGCSGGNYCPGNPVTRAQMAVFLLKSEHGSAYTPPACAGVFDDVPCPSTFAPWIEKLAAEGITGGCGGSNYCPNNTVTRKQMAPFLLKTLYGSTHTPPSCTGVFTDVACPGTFTNWIEELYHLGVTGGCVASPLQYCPDNPNTRAQMAVFLTKTFNLVW